MRRFKGANSYNQALRKRFPSFQFKGTIKDLLLHARINPSNENHIFIVGPPRAGTTLMQGIINAHSNVTSPDGETFFFVRRRTSQFASQEIPDLKKLIQQAESKVELFDKIAAYFKERDRADYFMEKTPEHALILSSLLSWYPRSKFLFVMRDGRDAFSSAFRNPGFFKKVGNRYPKLWRDTARLYLMNKNASNIRLVRYEALVNDPPRYISEIMEFLGIPFEGQQLDPKAYSRTSMARQKGHEMLSSAINPDSIGAFRRRLTKVQIEYFEKVAGTELDALGYGN